MVRSNRFLTTGEFTRFADWREVENLTASVVDVGIIPKPYPTSSTTAQVLGSPQRGRREGKNGGMRKQRTR